MFFRFTQLTPPQTLEMETLGKKSEIAHFSLCFALVRPTLQRSELLQISEGHKAKGEVV